MTEHALVSPLRKRFQTLQVTSHAFLQEWLEPRHWWWNTDGPGLLSDHISCPTLKPEALLMTWKDGGAGVGDTLDVFVPLLNMATLNKSVFCFFLLTCLYNWLLNVWAEANLLGLLVSMFILSQEDNSIISVNSIWKLSSKYTQLVCLLVNSRLCQEASLLAIL